MPLEASVNINNSNNKSNNNKNNNNDLMVPYLIDASLATMTRREKAM